MPDIFDQLIQQSQPQQQGDIFDQLAAKVNQPRQTIQGPKPSISQNMLNIIPDSIGPQSIKAPQLLNDLATIPNNFTNQFLVNTPRSMSNASGANVPFEAKNPAINAIAKGAGVAGMVMSPLNKLAFMKALGPGRAMAKAGQGAIAGAAYAPNDNPLNIEGRGVQAIGGALIGPLASKLENIPKDLRGTASRIQNWMVKLPNKAFNYSKDPMAVMAKEKVVGNSITDLAKGYEERLTQRSIELADAIKNNNKTIDISKIVDSNLENAASKAKGSLKDRTNNLIELQTVKDRIQKEFGDLSKISVSNAVKLKRQLADDFPFTQETAGDINTKAAHKAYHAINEAVEKAVPEIAELNQRVSGLIDITRAAKNRISVESRNNPLGLIQSLLGMGTAGAVGHTAGGIEGAAAGLGTAIVAKALSSPAILSRVAKGLSNMADVDKAALFKAYPEFKKIAVAALQGHTSVSKNRSLSIVDDIPAYLKERQSAPISPLGVKGDVTYIPPNKEPIPMKAPQNIRREQAKADIEKFKSSDYVKGIKSQASELPKEVKTLNDLVKKTPKGAKVAGGLTLAGLASSKDSEASKKKYDFNDENIMRTLLGEAEGEGFDGMNDVSSVLRVRKTIQGSYGIRAIVEKDGKYFRQSKDKKTGKIKLRQLSDKVIKDARKAVENSKKNNTSGGANHWFSKEDMKQANVQKMIKSMKLIKISGNHYLYKE